MEYSNLKPTYERFAALIREEGDALHGARIDVDAYLARATKSEVAAALRDFEAELKAKKAKMPSYYWSAITRLRDDICAKVDDPI